jgi:hypothetical protein
MAKKKRPKGKPPSRRTERQAKHPTWYSVPMGTLTMPSDEELLGLVNVVRMLVYVGRCAHWTADEPLLVQLAEVRRILEHVLMSGDMGRVALVLAIIRKIEEHLQQHAPEASAQPTD